MSRPFNFSAGPSALPMDVLLQVRDELLDFAGTGVSVMEISHRSQPFMDFAHRTDTAVRRVLAVPSDYHVLLLQGGSYLQFSQIPMNLFHQKKTADYIHTGLWSEQAANAARQYGEVRIIASSYETGFDRIPEINESNINLDAAYLHYTENETAQGLQFSKPPVSSIPLVCDACSSLMSKPLDISAHDLIYASAQKNMGIAGVTMVLLNPAILDKPLASTPQVLDFSIQAKKQSLLNTPSTFSWYVLGLTLEWIERVGGIDVLYEINKKKAQHLYGVIDKSNGFYTNGVWPDDRSINNVPFHIAETNLEDLFVKEAQKNGFHGLKGHQSTGGLRASIYNAVTLDAVQALGAFMREFERTHG
ncbi:3-phosphoserine/phosphohydroxythreonine transaminase [Alcaligenes sp. MMA]|uniref:3-phosphoserine/phosphohydroxythreonine transaminase n=1 Tax=Alcaligenes sp. MMA TaxID=2893019 RepID=UPI001E374D88|nr:3-phosphoserine/phosphohydroxythreonine transaminase [Alcaligenes sp. MMA]MCC9161781.1 3-phosphoserine/phosphohydroxythreonine transaminase [Alcaligenes sp. MMA]